MPVEIVDRARNEEPDSTPHSVPAQNAIEIDIAGGHQLRIVGSYDPEALARLIRGLSADPGSGENAVWCSKKHDRGWGRRGMRYPASEKIEIIRVVEQSHLPALRTLDT